MICKVCGAKIPEGLTVCELCGTTVEFENASDKKQVSEKTNEEKIKNNKNDYADPFWAGVSQNQGNCNGDNTEILTKEINSPENIKGDPSFSSSNVSESNDSEDNSKKIKIDDPFASTDAGTNDVVKDSMQNNNTNNDYNFAMNSANANSGFSNKYKFVISIMVGVIAIMIAVIIILCNKNY